jgi:hypothetical protein
MAYSVFDNQYYINTSQPKPKSQLANLPTSDQMIQNIPQPVESQSSQANPQMDWTSAASAATAGLSGYAQGVAGTDNYSIDNAAAVTGSVNGLMSGGWIGAITGGIGSAIGTTSEVNKNLKNLNTSVDGVTYTPDGRPVYQGGAILNANSQIRALNEGEAAAQREHIGATRVANYLYGNEDKIRRKRAELQRGIATSQAQFNRQNIGYQQQQLAQRAYNDQLKNVWGVPMNYY